MANLHPRIEALFKQSMDYWGARGQLGSSGSKMAMDSAPNDGLTTAAQGAAYAHKMLARLQAARARKRGMAFDSDPDALPGSPAAAGATLGKGTLGVDMGADALIEFLKDKLSPEDLSQIPALLEGGGTVPPAENGSPAPTGPTTNWMNDYKSNEQACDENARFLKSLGQDTSRSHSSYDSMFPQASRIRLG